MPKVVLARPLVAAGMKVLAAAKDVTVEVVEEVTPANILAALKDAEAIVFRPANYPFSDPELDASPKLKVVCRVGVGYDSIDVPALTRRGVQMATVGQANATTVAEHAVALMMGVGRKLVLFDRAMRDGSSYTVRFDELLLEFAGKTLVVVGFGRIGTRVVRRMMGWDMRIVVVDPLIDPARIRAAGAEPMELEAALNVADIVTLHCPLSDETRGLINERRLKSMKPSAILINTARGPIIDETALIQALKAKTIAAAGLDVTEIEPPEPGNELLTLPNVLLTPHNSAQSPECVDRMNVAAAENALQGMVGRVSADCLVNPEVFSR
ncbi:MAG: hydroxyacid dehydrogenase [Alphaproteobacteria bacterium]|nr:hydroxyacid dehydrogenase [Alphaproteobacteria bacterium]